LGLSTPRTIGTHNWSDDNPDTSLIFDNIPDIKTLFWPGSRIKGVDIQDENIQEGLRLTKNLLTAIKDKIEQNESDAELVVAIIPTKFSVYEDVVQESGKKNELFSDIIKNEALIKKDILELCDKERLKCIDLLSDLKSDINNGKKLYPESWDDHPIATGYKRYAEIIFENIKR